MVAPSSRRLLDGKYELVRPIGAGGMGTVHEARHRTTGRRVAVKRIALVGGLQNAALVSRFEREARAAGAIDSPYIAQILDAGTDGETGEPYLVMELLEGEDLSAASVRTARRPVEAELALRIAAQACLGLASAHAAGVIHRDIKPANIFLAHRGGDVVVKVLDFGIAKVTRELAQLTVSGVVRGSPRYMSPEQALGGQALDHRTDLWSLGRASAS